MATQNKLHPAQVATLRMLRSARKARFSELLRQTTLTSDTFKFHIHALTKAKYIRKVLDRRYELTAVGKEFANRLDKNTGREIEQPKSSLLLVVTSRADDGTIHYLAHQRQRQPFFGFWGIASAPLPRGVPVAETAARELFKQTGITASFSAVGVTRVIDKMDDGAVLEDKVFSVMSAEVGGMPVPHEWCGGTSQWMTRDALLALPKLFPMTEDMLTLVENGSSYSERQYVYTMDEY